VELDDASAVVELKIIEGDFTGEIVEVAVGGGFIACDDRCAAAVPAAGFTEGQMDVQ
jgi:hypothetical protein